ncbi:MAG: hypothetical protein ACOX3E_12005 [Desulfomonilia bacterium]|jgi:HAMP domain-containing protein|uniref:HAMP domain-containing protein n=1 Tax=anaerobic digester metagenome TaxID=1263854 RepID=A0A485LWG2_9ZZZZ|nr:hypothetical protein [Pseudomonadota bacterium]HON38758.1 hypothetical protein [Deltaproteobacteria bacterium]HRS56572.1 hypothetical protein [Desulfomonilia bacterium]HPD21920.1 hypothetical protein [Deltaproteobacteria bacterium]HPX18446.1 hypothetical protein [Deltaproteobacteria bacterium]
MKIASFAVAFCCLVVFLLGSALFVHTQMKVVGDLELSVLEERLYKENTDILSWAMASMDTEKLTEAPLPSSWGEILIVNNTSLVIENSTNQDHAGKKIHTIPQLLDEAAPILAAIKKSSRETVQTEEYVVATAPLSQNRTLLGFKPRSWEKGLVSQQDAQIKRSVDSLKTVLMIYLGGGLALAVIFSLIIAFISSRPLNRVAKAFEQLSLGDFDAELSPKGGKIMASLSDSFFRLKTSLTIALAKLGSR